MLAALDPYSKTMLLSTLHWPDEIRALDELELPEEEQTFKPAELTMAKNLVGAMKAEFDPANFHDDYREALLAVIEAKMDGQEVVRYEAPAEAPKLVDLMAVLEASVAAAKQGRAEAPAAKAAEVGARCQARPSDEGQGLDRQGPRGEGDDRQGQGRQARRGRGRGDPGRPGAQAQVRLTGADHEPDPRLDPDPGTARPRARSADRTAAPPPASVRALPARLRPMEPDLGTAPFDDPDYRFEPWWPGTPRPALRRAWRGPAGHRAAGRSAGGVPGAARRR